MMAGLTNDWCIYTICERQVQVGAGLQQEGLDYIGNDRRVSSSVDAEMKLLVGRTISFTVVGQSGCGDVAVHCPQRTRDRGSGIDCRKFSWSALHQHARRRQIPQDGYLALRNSKGPAVQHFYGALCQQLAQCLAHWHSAASQNSSHLAQLQHTAQRDSAGRRRL